MAKVSSHEAVLAASGDADSAPGGAKGSRHDDKLIREDRSEPMRRAGPGRPYPQEC